MPNVNINDRASVEAAYPKAQFDRDVPANAAANAAIMRGVLILSAPSGAGAFMLDAASRHVGEGNPESDTLFLAPHRMNAATSVLASEPGYGGPEEASAPRPGSADADYEAFIDQVLEAAKAARFKPAIGRDERLKGFRGG